MSTATKKRSKAAQQAEEEAQALKAMEPPDEEAAEEEAAEDIEIDEPIPYGLPADGVEFDLPPTPPTALEKQLEAKSDVDEAAQEEHRKAKAFDEIAALNTAASKAFDAWKRADEIAKGKKKGYEAAVNELRGLIDKTAHPEAMPLFDKPTEAPEDAPTTEVNPPDESWRDIPLREALPELTETIHGKLEGAQLFTMGELANWTAESGGRRRLTDIAGIGAGNAGKIEEATMAFWQRWKPAGPAETPEDKTVAANFKARKQFLDTKFEDLDIGDGPRMLLDSAGMKTVGNLEMSASMMTMGVFDRLKSLGMDDVEAQAVIETLNAENTRLAAGETS